MYHVELRQFPHNFCRFNLTERELRETILDAWAQGEWIDFGERKWNPHQAHLTVLEGPRLALEQLTMGRGWRAAIREGQDVTEQLLAAIPADAGVLDEADRRESGGVDAQTGRAGGPESRSNTATGASAHDMRLLADSLGLELLAKLNNEPVPLALVWDLARQRHPEWTASDCLKLAEYAVRSLAGSRLAVVLIDGHSGELESAASMEQIDMALRPICNWSAGISPWPVSIRRA